MPCNRHVALQLTCSITLHLETRTHEHCSHASAHDARLPSPPRLQCRGRPWTPHGSTSEAAAVGRARHAGPHECHCHLSVERARLHTQWPDVTQRPRIPRGLVPLPRLQSRDSAKHHHCRCGPASRVDPRGGPSWRLVRLSALSLTPAKHNLTLPSHVRSSLYISYPSNDAEVR